MAKRTKTHRSKLDFSSLLGVALALGGVLGGLILEGGKFSDVSQLTAALIVLGGTLGAVMITSPQASLIGAFRKLGSIFFETAYSPRETIEEIMSYAAKARRNGIVSLEQEIDTIPDHFLRKALSLVVDGTDVQEIRKMMELELEAQERRGRDEAKVYEAAGGYAPTIGIIGAVLGLIQVMKNISNVEMVGHGIAVAFVATVYGVASANLFF
ncbi:MAG: flagellar motor protein, partial [Bryobacteraceae bacterium]